MKVRSTKQGQRRMKVKKGDNSEDIQWGNKKAVSKFMGVGAGNPLGTITTALGQIFLLGLLS